MLAHVNSRLVRFIGRLPRFTYPLIGVEHIRVGLAVSKDVVRVTFTPMRALKAIWTWLNEPAFNITIRNNHSKE